jgi:hypothetical protein
MQHLLGSYRSSKIPRPKRSGGVIIQPELEQSVVALIDVEQSDRPAKAFSFGQRGKAVRSQWSFLRRFVRTAIERIQPPQPFQAEYEGSIPFTRSNRFSDLHCERYLLPAKQAEHFRQSFPGLFATFLPNSVSQPRRVSKFRSSNRVSRYASAVPCPAFDQNLVVIGILFLFVEQLFKQVIDERGVETSDAAHAKALAFLKHIVGNHADAGLVHAALTGA